MNKFVLILYIIIGFIVFVMLGTFISNYVEDFEAPLLKVCNDMNYTELTDWEHIDTFVGNYGNYVREFQIECDNKVLPGVVRIDNYYICVKKDKWSNCIDHDTKRESLGYDKYRLR